MNNITSARSEEYFNKIKNLIFKGAKNIRVDKFLISYIIFLRSLAGTMKILNADTIPLPEETVEPLHATNSNESISIEHDKNLIENNFEILSQTSSHTHDICEENVIKEST